MTSSISTDVSLSSIVEGISEEGQGELQGTQVKNKA